MFREPVLLPSSGERIEKNLWGGSQVSQYQTWTNPIDCIFFSILSPDDGSKTDSRNIVVSNTTT